MATLAELHSLIEGESALRNNVKAAILVAADIIAQKGDTASPPWDQTNNANRAIWAKQAFENPESKVDAMLNALLGANNTAAIANITGAADSTIQTNVNATVDLLADGS